MSIITVRFSDGTIERKDSDYVSKRSDGVLCALRLEQGTGATVLEPCEIVEMMSDRELVLTIHEILDGQHWNADTADSIAALLHRNGYPITVPKE